MVRSFLRYFVASAAVWVVFLCGFLCRDYLGEWLVAAHSGSFWEQIQFVFVSTIRLFITCAVVLCSLSIVISGSMFLFAVGQEVWYQLFKRKIINILMRQRRARQEEIQQAIEEEGDKTPRAPKESVSAVKHARKVVPPDVKERMSQLSDQGMENSKIEAEFADIEIVVTREPEDGSQ